MYTFYGIRYYETSGKPGWRIHPVLWMNQRAAEAEAEQQIFCGVWITAHIFSTHVQPIGWTIKTLGWTSPEKP
jgi:hypothetical protein